MFFDDLIASCRRAAADFLNDTTAAVCANDNSSRAKHLFLESPYKSPTYENKEMFWDHQMTFDAVSDRETIVLSVLIAQCRDTLGQKLGVLPQALAPCDGNGKKHSTPDVVDKEWSLKIQS